MKMQLKTTCRTVCAGNLKFILIKIYKHRCSSKRNPQHSACRGNWALRGGRSWALTGDGSRPLWPEKSSESGRVSKGDRFSSSTLSSISVRAVRSVASLSSSNRPLAYDSMVKTILSARIHQQLQNKGRNITLHHTQSAQYCMFARIW